MRNTFNTGYNEKSINNKKIPIITASKKGSLDKALSDFMNAVAFKQTTPSYRQPMADTVAEACSALARKLASGCLFHKVSGRYEGLPVRIGRSDFRLHH